MDITSKTVDQDNDQNLIKIAHNYNVSIAEKKDILQEIVGKDHLEVWIDIIETNHLTNHWIEHQKEVNQEIVIGRLVGKEKEHVLIVTNQDILQKIVN